MSNNPFLNPDYYFFKFKLSFGYVVQVRYFISINYIETIDKMKKFKRKCPICGGTNHWLVGCKFEKRRK